jgi:hypothetical protein
VSFINWWCVNWWCSNLETLTVNQMQKLLYDFIIFDSNLVVFMFKQLYLLWQISISGLCFCAPTLVSGIWIYPCLSVLLSVLPFSFVPHFTQKVFDLESWNFTGMLISMCSCVHGYFHLDIFSIFRVIALDLVKFCIFNFSVACNSKSIWQRVMKLYRNVDQHV